MSASGGPRDSQPGRLQAAGATPARPAPGLYIGLMSGTSVDGVDGVLARLAHGQPPQVLASASLDMPSALRAELLALNRRRRRTGAPRWRPMRWRVSMPTQPPACSTHPASRRAM